MLRRAQAFIVVLGSLLCFQNNVVAAEILDGIISEKNHVSAKLNNKRKYVVGCDLNMSDITTGLFQVVGKKLHLVYEVTSKTSDINMKKDFTNYFVAILQHIKEKQGVNLNLVCIACPGNTNATKDCITFSHLSFSIDGRAIKAQFPLDRIFVINDFEVVGFGIQALDKRHFVTLHEGKPREHGTKLIIGAGNGLGSGLMFWNDKMQCFLPSPISYSFVDFCAQSEQELQLGEYLQKETGSRSWGKVLGSAGGIRRMYAFLSKKNFDDVEYKHYQDVFDHRNDDHVAGQAVDMYMKLYARLIRSATYAQLPYNGVYIMNGVAEKNPELIKDPSFMKEIFKTDNDYLTNYLSEIPMYLVDQSNLYMHGAALYALLYSGI